jgi:hypothetical protein
VTDDQRLLDLEDPDQLADEASLFGRVWPGALGAIAVPMPGPVHGDDAMSLAEESRDAGLKVQEAGAGTVYENDGRPGASIRVV